MNLRDIGPVVRRLRDRLVFAGLRVIADRKADAERFQIVLQQRLFLRCRPFVNTVQRRVLGTGDEVGRADVGGEHRFFDQPVRLGARARNDLLDAAVLVTDDLRLGRLEVDRTTLATRLQQGAIRLVEVQQMRHQRCTFCSFGAARVAEDRGHFRVGEARRRADDGREKLICVDLAAGIDQHVAHHGQPLDLRVQ